MFCVIAAGVGCAHLTWWHSMARCVQCTCIPVEGLIDTPLKPCVEVLDCESGVCSLPCCCGGFNKLQTRRLQASITSYIIRWSELTAW